MSAECFCQPRTRLSGASQLQGVREWEVSPEEVKADRPPAAVVLCAYTHLLRHTSSVSPTWAGLRVGAERGCHAEFPADPASDQRVMRAGPFSCASLLPPAPWGRQCSPPTYLTGVLWGFPECSGLGGEDFHIWAARAVSCRGCAGETRTKPVRTASLLLVALLGELGSSSANHPAAPRGPRQHSATLGNTRPHSATLQSLSLPSTLECGFAVPPPPHVLTCLYLSGWRR